MIGTIPTQTEAEKERVARLQGMGAEKSAPLVGFLLSDAAADASGQIFAARMNEIFLMGQSRPVRSVHRAECWNCRNLAQDGTPALKPSIHHLHHPCHVLSVDHGQSHPRQTTT